MATAVFGRKKYMTQAFQDDGTLVSVTVIEVEPNFVTAVKTDDEHGYDAVQVGFGTVPTRKLNRPHAGQFEKHETPPRQGRHGQEPAGRDGGHREQRALGARRGAGRQGLGSQDPEGG